MLVLNIILKCVILDNTSFFSELLLLPSWDETLPGLFNIRVKTFNGYVFDIFDKKH